MRGSSITQGSTGGRCAATDLRGSFITQESTGGSCAADYCCGSCSCGGVIQCGTSENELSVELIDVLIVLVSASPGMQ